MPQDKLSVSQFAAKVKEKYPEYNDMTDEVLVGKILDKYPVYGPQVDYTPKKKGLTVSPSSDGDLPSQEVDTESPFSIFDPVDFNQGIGPLNQPGPDSRPLVETLIGLDDLSGQVTSQTPILSELIGGSNRLFAGILDYADMWYQSGLNAMLPDSPINNKIKTEYKQGKLKTPLTEVADMFTANADYYKRMRSQDGIFAPGLTDEDLEKGWSSHIVDGDIGKGVFLLTDGILENVPGVAVAATTPGGIALLGASSGGNKFRQIKDDPRYTSGEKIAYSSAQAVVEAASEMMFMGDLNTLRKALGGSTGRQVRNDFVTKVSMDGKYLRDLSKKSAKMGNQEGIEEVAVEVYDLAATAIKEEPTLEAAKDRFIRESGRIVDAYGLGFGSAVGINLTANGTNSLGSKKNAKARAKETELIKKLQDELSNASPEKAVSLREIIKQETAKLQALIEEDREYYRDFSDADRKAIIDIDNEIAQINEALEYIDDKDMRADREQRLVDLFSQRNAIHDKYPEVAKPKKPFKGEAEPKPIELNLEVPESAQPTKIKDLVGGRVEYTDVNGEKSIGTLQVDSELRTYLDNAIKDAEENVAKLENELLLKKNRFKGQQIDESELNEAKQELESLKEMRDSEGYVGNITLLTDQGDIVEIGNLNDVGEQFAEDLNIKKAESAVSIDGDVITVRGKEYTNGYSDPLAAINRDENGNIVSVTLDAADGSKRTFRGNTADELAYNIIMSQYEDQALEQELETLIEQDEEIAEQFNELEESEPVQEAPVEEPAEDTEQAPETEVEQAPVQENVQEEVQENVQEELEEEVKDEPKAETKSTEEVQEEPKSEAELLEEKLYENLEDDLKYYVDNQDKLEVFKLKLPKSYKLEVEFELLKYPDGTYAHGYNYSMRKMPYSGSSSAANNSLEGRFKTRKEAIDEAYKYLLNRISQYNDEYTETQQEKIIKALDEAYAEALGKDPKAEVKPKAQGEKKKEETKKEEAKKEEPKTKEYYDSIDVGYRNVILIDEETSEKDKKAYEKFYNSETGQESIKILLEIRNKAGMNFDFKFNPAIAERVAASYSYGARILLPATSKDGKANGVAEVSVDEAVKNIRAFAKEYKLDRSKVEANLNEYQNKLYEEIQKVLPRGVDIKFASNFSEALRENGLPVDILTYGETTYSNFNVKKALDIVFDENGKLVKEKPKAKTAKPKPKVDQKALIEDIKIVEDEIESLEFSISNLEEEIDIEKGNIAEYKADSKEQIQEVRNSKMSNAEKKESITTIKDETAMSVEMSNDNIDVYKEDIKAEKSDLRKAKKRLEKLQAKLEEQPPYPDAVEEQPSKDAEFKYDMKENMPEWIQKINPMVQLLVKQAYDMGVVFFRGNPNDPSNKEGISKDLLYKNIKGRFKEKEVSRDELFNNDGFGYFGGRENYPTNIIMDMVKLLDDTMVRAKVKWETGRVAGHPGLLYMTEGFKEVLDRLESEGFFRKGKSKAPAVKPQRGIVDTYNDLSMSQAEPISDLATASKMIGQMYKNEIIDEKAQDLQKGVSFKNVEPAKIGSGPMTRKQATTSPSFAYMPALNKLLEMGFEIHLLNGREQTHGLLYNKETKDMTMDQLLNRYSGNSGKKASTKTAKAKKEKIAQQVQNYLEFVEKGGSLQDLVAVLNYFGSNEIIVKGGVARMIGDQYLGFKNNPTEFVKDGVYNGEYNIFTKFNGSSHANGKSVNLAVEEWGTDGNPLLSKQEVIDAVSEAYDIPKEVAALDLFNDRSSIDKLEEGSKEEAEVLDKAEKALTPKPIEDPEEAKVVDIDGMKVYTVSNAGGAKKVSTSFVNDIYQKGMTFGGIDRVQQPQDFAFLLRHLRTAESENAFAVVSNEATGEYKVLWLGSGAKNGIDIEAVDIAGFVSKAKETLGPYVAVTLVHNHPSGVIKASEQDKQAHKELYDYFNTDHTISVKPSIIINLDSGQFGIFDYTGETTDTEYKGPSKGQDSFDVLGPSFSKNKPRFRTSRKLEFNVPAYTIDRNNIYFTQRHGAKTATDIAKMLTSTVSGGTGGVYYAVLDEADFIKSVGVIPAGDLTLLKFNTLDYSEIAYDMVRYGGEKLVISALLENGQELEQTSKELAEIKKRAEYAINHVNKSAKLQLREEVDVFGVEDKSMEERIKEGFEPMTREDMYGKPMSRALNKARIFMDKILWNEVQKKVISAKETMSSMLALDNKDVISRAKDIQKSLARARRKHGNKIDDLATKYFTNENEAVRNKTLKEIDELDPKLGKLLKDARNYIDSRSKRVMNIKNLPQETKELIESQLGFYVHRSFYFFDHPFFKVSKGAKEKAINTELMKLMIEEAHKYRAIDNVSDDMAVELVEKRIPYLRRQAVRNIDTYLDSLKKQRRDVRKGKSTGGGIKVDESSLIEKKDIPEHILQLLGEVKDAPSMFLSTANTLNSMLRGRDMAFNIERTLKGASMYQIKSKEMFGKAWKDLSDNQKALVTTRVLNTKLIKMKHELTNSDKNSFKQINNPVSPLHKKFVHVSILEVMEDVALYQSGNRAADAYLFLQKAQRQTKVLGTPSTWVKNAIGGLYFITLNGGAALGYLPKTFGTLATKYIANSNVFDDMVAEMSEVGLIGRDVTSNIVGMNAILYSQSFGENSSLYNNWIAKNRGAWSSFVKNLGSKYASIDDFTKMVIYQHERSLFALKLYGESYENLNPEQQKDVREQAAERVKQNTPTFSRAEKLSKKFLESRMPFGDFVLFTVESLRSFAAANYNVFKDAEKLMTDKSLNSKQRTAYIGDILTKSAGISLLGTGILATIIQSLAGDDDDRNTKKNKELASMVRPGWLENRDIIVDKVNKNMTIEVYDYTGLDPYATITNLDEYRDILSPNMTLSTLYNAMNGTDVYGRSLTDPTDPYYQRAADILKYAGKEIFVSPAISSAVRDAKKRAESDPSINVYAESLRIFGDRVFVRTYEYNLVQQFRYDVKDIKLNNKENYTNTDYPEHRKKHLNRIKDNYNGLQELAGRMKNYKAQLELLDIVERNFDDYEQSYILYGIEF